MWRSVRLWRWIRESLTDVKKLTCLNECLTFSPLCFGYCFWFTLNKHYFLYNIEIRNYYFHVTFYGHTHLKSIYALIAVSAKSLSPKQQLRNMFFLGGWSQEKLKAWSRLSHALKKHGVVGNTPLHSLLFTRRKCSVYRIK